MSLDLNALVVFAQVPGSTAGTYRAMASYSTDDTAGGVETAGYFNNAAAMLPAGSQIFVAGDLDGTPFQKQYVVASNDGSTVAITPQANITFNEQVVINTTIDLTNGSSGHVPMPIAGTIDKIYTVLKGGAVTTNNATCTFKIGTTAITDGVVTVTASGSAIGDVDVATPSAANTVAAGDYVQCTVSNTPGGSRTAEVTLLISPT